LLIIGVIFVCSAVFLFDSRERIQVLEECTAQRDRETAELRAQVSRGQAIPSGMIVTQLCATVALGKVKWLFPLSSLKQ
jgi:hypothetical protein